MDKLEEDVIKRVMLDLLNNDAFKSVLSEALEEKDQDWPQEGDEYWFPTLLQIGLPPSEKFKEGPLFSEGLKKKKLCFKTPEKAELFTKQCLLMRAMQARAEELNEGWVADWGNGYQEKHGIVGDDKNNYCTKKLYSNNNFVYGIALIHKNGAELLLKEFGQQIEELYGK